MLKKIENLYLAIVRIVVIAASSILILAAMVLGISSLSITKSAPEHKEPVFSISDEKLIQNLTKRDNQKNIENSAKSTKAASEDPNKVNYERSAVAVGKFLLTISSDEETNKDELIVIFKNLAEKYGEDNLTSIYAKNMADTFERLLPNPQVVNAGKSLGFAPVINGLVKLLTEQFETQISETKKENDELQRNYIESKEKGAQSLYLAGGTFGGFLLIVFLSIVIRIERSLRNLEKLPVSIVGIDRN